MSDLSSKEKVDAIMEKAKEFASSWALVGGKFDSGDMLECADQSKEELRTMIEALCPADEPAETHPMLTVLTICDAYESGMGQGLARREFRNPYDPVNDPHAYRAYGHGYDEGVKRRAAEPPTDALTLEQLTAAIAYMGCDTDREYTPEAFARDLFAAARQSSTKDSIPLGAETRAATSRGARSTEDAGRPQPSDETKGGQS